MCKGIAQSLGAGAAQGCGCFVQSGLFMFGGHDLLLGSQGTITGAA